MNMNIIVTPLAGADRLSEQPGSVGLYLSDPDSALNLPATALQSLYNMTPKEANVAIALSNGLSPSQISEQHGVSIDTVRSQLKSIYSKMVGTRINPFSYTRIVFTNYKRIKKLF